MRIIQADCKIYYDGRGQTVSNRARRLIIVKGDGSVLIHSDAGIKPVNYMPRSVEIGEYDSVDDETGLPVHVLISSTTRETIRVLMYDILLDQGVTFSEEEQQTPDQALERVGTEKDIQRRLFEPETFRHVFGDSAMPLAREAKLGNGAVDLVGTCLRDGTRALLLVETKRRAKRNDVYQVVRYMDAAASLLAKAREEGLDVTYVRVLGGLAPVPVEALAHPVPVLAACGCARTVPGEAHGHGVIWRDLSLYPEFSMRTDGKSDDGTGKERGGTV